MRTSRQTDERPGGTVQRCPRGKSLFLCALLFSAVIGLVVAIVFSIIRCDLESCNTTECLVLLARLQKAQNGTIDPCEDFFNYVCGNWEANKTWGMSMPSVNVFDVLLEENHLIMKKLLGRGKRQMVTSMARILCRSLLIYLRAKSRNTF